jgi:hypothetical protein
LPLTFDLPYDLPYNSSLYNYSSPSKSPPSLRAINLPYEKRYKKKIKKRGEKNKNKKLKKFPSNPPPLTPSLPSEVFLAFPHPHLLPTLRYGAVDPYMPLD